MNVETTMEAVSAAISEAVAVNGSSVIAVAPTSTSSSSSSSASSTNGSCSISAAASSSQPDNNNGMIQAVHSNSSSNHSSPPSVVGLTQHEMQNPTNGITLIQPQHLDLDQQQQQQQHQMFQQHQHHLMQQQQQQQQMSGQQQHHVIEIGAPQQTNTGNATSMGDDSSDGMSQHYNFSEDTNVQMADSNSPKQTFVPCKVCGDKASGYHYGVTSCEGCKGFFRRSIQKQIEYRCLRDGKCLVIRLNRNRCQYCRFKKCLAVGMSRDSVRYGRVPKRSKSQEEQRVTTTEGSQDQTALESKQLAIYDIILTISQAHHANCVLTEDKIKAITRKPLSLIPKLEPGLSETMTTEELEASRLLVFSNLAVIITGSIQRVVEFAKRVPGFHELSQDDQLILIKAGFFEIWLTRLTRMFNGTDKTLTFGDGSVISRDQLEVVFTEELAAAMFDFAHSFSQLRLNDTEMGLFTGVVLATADRQGLTNVKGVEMIQDKLIEALKLQISRNHSTEPHMFANILMKLPELRMLGTKHTDQLAWYRGHWASLRLPPLFAEIYDVPKSEEDFNAVSHS